MLSNEETSFALGAELRPPNRVTESAATSFAQANAPENDLPLARANAQAP